MSLRFVKMHGLGNDFVILDEVDRDVKDAPALAQQLCARRYGVGADGLIVLTTASPAQTRVRFFNADGSRAEMCGNGMRCAAHYMRWRHGVPAAVCLHTDVGLRECLVGGDPWDNCCQVRVDMGLVQTDGVVDEGAWHGQDVALGQETVSSFAIGVGNPHLVLMRKPDPEEVQTLGPQLCQHPAFSQGTNVEWLELTSTNRVEAAVYERGVGPTQACGSGAVAVVAALVLQKKIESGQAVTVVLPGGELLITIQKDWHAWLEGPSQIVFEGRVSHIGKPAEN